MKKENPYITAKYDDTDVAGENPITENPYIADKIVGAVEEANGEVTITFQIGNSAFEEDWNGSCKDILTQAMKFIASNNPYNGNANGDSIRDDSVLRDPNGNRVGRVEVDFDLTLTEDEDEDEDY